ncbi:hypothetical protein LXA47_31385 [Massilia sp. P8910]|uniref:hypothetical protein n=1 Tax=Massilia antarctica TaxID=2765360 RepID=UPI001E386BD3|nr:hypothetical protein [Massilia antarctica]MCE3608075.1 hypothetical protein [Massilia antarctica]
MTEKSELEILFPEVEIEVRGEPIRISPFKVGKWIKVMKMVSAMQPIIAKHIKGEDVNMMGIMFDAGDPVMDLIALAINKPRAWLDEASGDEAIRIATVVFNQNKEEFVKKMMPLLGDLLGLVGTNAAEGKAPASTTDGEPSTTN